MDKLSAMVTFTRVAELGSLSAAARHLRLTQPAVSQQIASLEQQLGVLLIYRTTRSVTLSEAGLHYYQQILPVLAALEEAEEALQGLGSRLRGNLRIHAPSGFGQLHLTPLAIAFQQQHPELNIELLLADSLVDVVGEGIDVAIRFGELPAPGTVARRLGEVQRVLVASPGYLAQHGPLNTLSELSKHPHIRYSGSMGNSLTLSGTQGNEIVNIRTVFRANNTFALLAAIEAGLGVGGAQLPLIGEALKQGKLAIILPDYHYPPLPVHAVYPATRFIPTKVRAWVDFLVHAMSDIEGVTPPG